MSVTRAGPNPLMKPTEEIVEKIRKCLALANGLNATQGEMEVAMAKAKEIAIRHNIDIASIGLDDPNAKGGIDITTDKTLRTRSEYEQPYHRWIFNVLEEVFGVKVVRMIRRDYNGIRISCIVLIGDTVDVAIAKEIFPWLEKVFPRTLSRLVHARKLTYCAADTNGCYYGFYRGIVEANKREEEKLTKKEASSMALVVRKKEDLIQTELEEQFPHAKVRSTRHKEMNGEAFHYGKAEGSRIKLNQLGASKPGQQIRKGDSV